MTLFSSLNGSCPNIRQETAAIYTIVSRNLQSENWRNLLPEAQTQMISEADELLRSRLLLPHHKQHLLALVGAQHSEQA